MVTKINSQGASTGAPSRPRTATSTTRKTKGSGSRLVALRRAVIPTTTLWVLATLMGFPLLWFLLSSLKHPGELFSYPLTFLPRQWSFDGYQRAWERLDFVQYFTNTFIVASVSTALTVFLCAAAGYALAKYKNPWLAVFGLCILTMTMLPGEIMLNPMFVVVRDLGMYNSLWGVIMPSIVTPTGVFMFRQFFVSVPDELIDAARIDGAKELAIFFRIMIPLARPILLTLAVISFQWRWNDYIFPLIILSDPDRFTLQIALRTLIGAENIDWSILLAASVLSMIPLVVIYLVFQRYITSSNLNAGLKD